MSLEDDLGPLTRIYETDTRERRKRALILLTVGAVVALPAIVWATIEGKQLHQSDTITKGALAPTFIAFIAVMLLVLGAVLFAGFRFNRDEKFHVYQHGLVHETRDDVVLIWWRDIHRIAPQLGSLTHWGLGGDTGFRLKLNSGQTVYITGFTDNASELRGRIENGMSELD